MFSFMDSQVSKHCFLYGSLSPRLIPLSFPGSHKPNICFGRPIVSYLSAYLRSKQHCPVTACPFILTSGRTCLSSTFFKLSWKLLDFYMQHGDRHGGPEDGNRWNLGAWTISWTASTGPAPPPGTPVRKKFPFCFSHYQVTLISIKCSQIFIQSSFFPIY